MGKTIDQIIEYSGHKLTSEVQKLFESWGWTTELGRSFPDLVTGKPRESDIIARKNVGLFDVILVIETVWLKDPVVFWKYPLSREKLISALSSNITFSLEEDWFEKNIEFFHHAKEGWVSSHHSKENPDLFEDILKTFSGSECMKRETGSFFRETIYYHLLICDGEQMVWDDKTEINKVIYFQELSIKNGENFDPTPFFVDVIKKTELKCFVENLLGGEITAIKQYVRQRNNNRKMQKEISEHRRNDLDPYQ